MRDTFYRKTHPHTGKSVTYVHIVSRVGGWGGWGPQGPQGHILPLWAQGTLGAWWPC